MRLSRALSIAAVCLLVTAVLASLLGVRYEISQLPIEQRNQMDDFDWIGMQWIFRGMVLAALGLLCGLFGFAFYPRGPRSSDRPAS